MLGIPVGFVVANFTEWAFHKYVLHGLGKRKGSIWYSHWNEHHKHVRKNGMLDPDYTKSFEEILKTPEVLALLGTGLVLMPLGTKFPWFAGTAFICGAGYFFLHRHSHIDDEWSRKWLPWHVRHHLGKNQDSNFCVTLPFADWVLGTDDNSYSVT